MLYFYKEDKFNKKTFFIVNTEDAFNDIKTDTSESYLIYKDYVNKKIDSNFALKKYKEILANNRNNTFTTIKVLTNKARLLIDLKEYDNSEKILLSLINQYHLESDYIIEALYLLGELYSIKSTVTRKDYYNESIQCLEKILTASDTSSFNYYRALSKISDIRYRKIIKGKGNAFELLNAINFLLKNKYTQYNREQLRLSFQKYNILVKIGKKELAFEEKIQCKSIYDILNKNNQIPDKIKKYYENILK